MMWMWERELNFWRLRIERGRGGPVKLRIEAIETIDLMLEHLEQAHKDGRLQPIFGARKN
jgi:hypothetical protein